jgi:hypothetical protein
VERIISLTTNQRSELRCLDGSRACPPEDSGGAWNYNELLIACTDPDHSKYQEALETFGDLYDPMDFDINAINVELAKYQRWSRHRPLKLPNDLLLTHTTLKRLIGHL